ncbi:plasma-membrane proton-efflux P-type ATPase [Cyanobacterium aponinum]|uniref:plasma-membrane proton-efflux P-type ATPase n=1 Tax=Cyanobacterium aponinum TaxID=379064 RepID=UPI000C12B4E3|nr:plasma-membrane proton-efflux P-type ATPase [Cyanobacterium aponinum]PHV62175.1 plasma-membrane proton-efflux P-type ATPase [Cyanobacterium aponinum IPPAS B-1201]
MSEISTSSIIPDVSNLSLEEAIKSLNSSATGLSSGEAENRISQYGYNELASKTVNPILQFLSYFWNPISWMIEAAVIFSAAVGDWADFIIISVLLLGNGLIGFFEEKSAGDAVAALKAQLALNAIALRDQKWTSIPAKNLVPGDVIRIKIGDVLPADCMLLECDPLKIDQAALTGESLPVNRSTGEVVYSGSVCKKGQAEAIVTATGVNTFFGKTAKLVADTENSSHFQKAVLKIGNFLIIIAMVLIAVIVIERLLSGELEIVRLLKFCLVLTVASIPVAMPTVLSVSMSAGAQQLAKRDTVVTRLSSIEELAGMNLLCSDKTGTLTLNQLTLGEPFLMPNVSEEDLILMATLASQSDDPDPIDSVITSNLTNTEQLNNYQVTHFTPFDPISKRTEALVKTTEGKKFAVSKGAPQVILDLAIDKGKIKAKVNNAIESYAKKGYRALGVAKTNEQGEWHLLGVISLFDPPRPDSKMTITEAGKLGVPVKMVTGDQVLIGKETSRQLGLGTDILDAKIFRETPATMIAQLDEQILQADGFGQVFPEDKYHIVDTFQKHGNIVGMTGDGVNDAPALKKADVGIAVSGATDAARAAADIVLLSPGLSVIVDAIKLSRQIFARMTNYTLYRITATVQILVFTTLAILFFDSYPLTAIMIVLLALLNDGAIMTIAFDNAKIAPKPQQWKMSEVLTTASVLGAINVTATFLIYFLAKKYWTFFEVTDKLHPAAATPLQTLVFFNIALLGMMTLYSVRTRDAFWTLSPAKPFLLATGISVTISTLLAIFGFFDLIKPIGFAWALFNWGYCFIWFLILDRTKITIKSLFDNNNQGLGSKYLKQWDKLKMRI